MRVGSLFSGIGVLDYGLHLAGMDHVWFCEKDKFRQSILSLRWPEVPIHDDIRILDTNLLGPVDIIAGGFPPGGFSSLGPRRGFDNPGIALWRDMARCIRDVRPRWVLVESLSQLLRAENGGFFGEILGSLASLGYSVEWDCLPAAAFGAPHRRDRVFITAHLDSDGQRCEVLSGQGATQAVKDSGRAGSTAEEFPWGEYGPSIIRWGVLLGRPVPQPLIRRVDDGAAGLLERRRVSAICDGILVQAAEFCGRRIIAYEAAST